MNGVREENYKDYKIEIHPQPKTGDNTKVFLGVWKNNEKVFSVWEQISGTESRSKEEVEIVELLISKGLDNIRKLIDDGAFETDKEYKYWETIN
jgi:hypothetical protein